MYFKTAKEFAKIYSPNFLCLKINELEDDLENKVFVEFLALALLFLVWVRPLWSNTEKMSFTDFAKFLYDVEKKMEMFTEIEEDFALYDAITNAENSFAAPGLNDNPDKSTSQLLVKLLQRTQPWKTEIGSLFRKTLSLMKHRVISKNYELFIMHRFIDFSFSLTNSAQESVFARFKYVKMKILQ